MVYNTKIIDYGDYLHIQWYDRHIIRKDEDESIAEINKIVENNNIINNKQSDMLVADEKAIERSLKVSANRSKNNLFRIARSNEWDLFVTLTFDRTNTDTSNYDEVSKKVNKFTAKIRKQCPYFKYLVVPELHKDKINYHFHGLFYKADSLEMVYSGHTDSEGAKIYNLPDWEWGFSYAMKIKNQSAVRNYIGKYISKDLMNNLKYKKRYYASDNVNIAEEYLCEMSIDTLYERYADRISHAKTITIDKINRIKYFEVKKDVDNEKDDNYNNDVKEMFSE